MLFYKSKRSKRVTGLCPYRGTRDLHNTLRWDEEDEWMKLKITREVQEGQNESTREEQQGHQALYGRGTRDEQQRYNRGPTQNWEYIIHHWEILLTKTGGYCTTRMLGGFKHTNYMFMHELTWKERSINKFQLANLLPFVGSKACS